MNIQELYQLYKESEGVSTDTRTLQSGQLFFALSGERFDGNIYASIAIESGASYAVVDDPSVVSSERYVLVPDTLKALQLLAKYHRDQLTIPVIGITGSNGKTTTKELLVSILSSKYKVAATKGNYNNHIGVPLTILAVDKDAEVLIVEMGTNQPGDIEELCEIASPTHGLITNIGAAHLEKLGSEEGVFIEKRELFNKVKNSNGVFFLNKGNDFLSSLTGSSEQNKPYDSTGGSYGTITISKIPSAYLSMDVTSAGANSEMIHLETYLSGSYNIENISAAIEVGHHFDVSLDQMAKAISSYHPDNMRSQIVETDRNRVILDAYNANPSSMSHSLTALSKETGECLAIIGDMLELGVKSAEYHIEIVAKLKQLSIKEAILIGPIFNSVQSREYDQFLNTQELMESGKLDEITGKTILIKASRGMKLESVLPYL